MLPDRLSQQQRFITPEPLNVAPQLIGMPLAPPARRAAAMLVDLVVVALLTGVSGFWLLGGLALVLLQLRSRQGASARRKVFGWAAAGVIGLLAVAELHGQWSERHAEAEPQQATALAPPGVAPAGLPPDPAASTAAATPVLSDAQRIEQLEAEIAQLRRPRGWREQLDSLLDEIGLGLGWGIVYFSLLPAWWGGQTVGKKLLKLRVVELTGAPMTVMRCLRRYGGYAAGMATGGIGFAQMLWDPNRQAVQDRTAHTAVIDLRTPRLQESAPGEP